MIRIKNLTRVRIDIDYLKRAAERILDGEKKSGAVEISIVLLGEKRMRRINREYRGEDRPTDVLSFAFSEGKSKFPAQLLGEIIICPMVVKKRARERGELFQKGLVRTLIHGFLHILGYNHEKEEDFLKMKKKEEYYISHTY